MENRHIIIGAVIAIIIVAGIAAFSGIGKEQQTVNKRPIVNVSDVSYKVSIGKPEVAMFADAAEEPMPKTSGELTIYNQDLALVKDVREMSLEKGVNEVKFTDVPSKIDATSVLFRDMAFPSTYVVEQNYEYDLVNTQKILEKYLGKEISVSVSEGNEAKRYAGKLLGYSDGIVLDTGNGIVSLSSHDAVSFPQLPQGLLTKPTLVWKIYSNDAGKRQTETAYLTGGLEWKANYVAVSNTDDTKMDFGGWTTITNTSGTDYPDTKLKLVAGEVHRVEDGAPYREAYDYAVANKAAAPQQFGSQALFEYYLYTLQGRTTIKNNETKQISLLSAESVPVNKEYVFDGSGGQTYYYGGSGNGKVEVRLSFKNSESQGLGVPLPKGTVRVYKRDSDGQLQFLGEDSMDNTKKEDEVSVLVGNAFDITGERVQVSSDNTSRGVTKEQYRITLENQKDEAVKVRVKEHLYGGSWTISGNSQPYEKKSSTEIDFIVEVPAKGKAEVSYTVEYRHYY